MVRPTNRRSPFRTFGAIAAIATAMLAIMMSIGWGVSAWWGYFLGINLVSFAFYGYDKRSAKRQNQNRVPEWVLHFLALAGGTPLAFVAQRMFRHKTSKQPFQLIFSTIGILQTGLILYMIIQAWQA